MIANKKNNYNKHKAKKMSITNLKLKSQSDILNKKPRRHSEIWKFDNISKKVHAIGPEGVVQFNAIGSAIWIKLDGRHTIASIIEELLSAYPDQDQNQIQNDIISFISYLVNHYLIILDWQPL